MPTTKRKSDSEKQRKTKAEREFEQTKTNSQRKGQVNQEDQKPRAKKAS